jgi:polynucleotide 5'-hydroxyl-kinase GRC3/NOL9
MVFAPKETAKSIGWARSDNEDGSKSNTKNGEISPSKNKGSKRKVKRSSSSSVTSTPDSHKRVKDNEVLQDEDPRSSPPEVLQGSSEKTDDSYYGPQYFGPQLPSGESNDVTNNIKMLPPGTCQDFHIIKDIVSTVITFKEFDKNVSRRVAINGMAKIKALEGSFDIMGYHLSSSSEETIVLESPTWMSAICIEPAASKIISKIQISSMSKNICTFELSSPLATKSILIAQQWKSIAKEIQDSCLEGSKRIMVSGAKSTGKSTYVRYVINKLLSDCEIGGSDGPVPYKEIALLDCDVGQPEFSAPGMVSLTMITKPILSPPNAHIVCGKKDQFTIVTEHEMACFYGFTTSKSNPIRYVDAIKSILQKYHELCEEKGNIPLIINTDGWVKGMGYEILSSLIGACNPHHIVQILGSTKAKYFDLTPHSSPDRTIHVAGSVGGTHYDPLCPSPALSRNSSLASMDSIQGSGQGGYIVPFASSLTRNLRFCTYFSGGVEAFMATGATFGNSGIIDESFNLAMKLSCTKPYIVPFDSLDCIVVKEDGNESVLRSDDCLEILNSSIVGLCGKNDGQTRSCYGLGIVRSIDLTHRLFYVLSPVKASILRASVKAIVTSQLQIPIEMTFCGEYSESFPHLSFEGASVAIGGDIMKSKSAHGKK